VPLSRSRSSRALAPEVCFMRPDRVFRQPVRPAATARAKLKRLRLRLGLGIRACNEPPPRSNYALPGTHLPRQPFAQRRPSSTRVIGFASLFFSSWSVLNRLCSLTRSETGCARKVSSLRKAERPARWPTSETQLASPRTPGCPISRVLCEKWGATVLSASVDFLYGTGPSLQRKWMPTGDLSS
jgi:hypothetical protein